MSRPLTVTTPIYYVNGRPHIGHAYSTIASDVIRRYAQLRGRRTFLLTGTDEHGQKIERSAKEEGLSPEAFLERLVPAFREAWQALGCAPDDFIRTTDARHQRFVRALWKRCVDAGDIYLGAYEGWYSVADETFYTDKDLVDGKAPTGRPVERVKEASYFFRLSRFAEPLLAYYEAHPSFVRPEGRMNEVKAFVRGGLEDLSISRTGVRWGVPVPDAPDHVIYVWFDALSNYLSALGGPQSELGAELWEPRGEVLHVVGKEILRFHAVYWPAFLMSAGIPLPTGVFAHGWMTIDGQKMSKTAGNFLPPLPIAEAVGSDVLRYHLMRDLAFGQDGDFSHQSLLTRYHGELASGLGNLVQRIAAGTLEKSLGGELDASRLGPEGAEEREVRDAASTASAACAAAMDELAPHKALEAAFSLVAACNRYVDRREPWKLAKAGDEAGVARVCHTIIEALRQVSVMLWPIMPEKATQMRARFGLGPLLPTEGLDLWPSVWGALPPRLRTQPGPALFPRWDDDAQRAILSRLGAEIPPELQKQADKPAAAAKEHAKASAPALKIEDLSKVDLRLALVLEAAPVEGSDKLLELKVDAGDPEPRTILAGIGEHYTAEQLIDKRVLIVANLAPREFKKFGKTSHGMILAVKDAAKGALSVLGPDKEIPAGTRAS